MKTAIKTQNGYQAVESHPIIIRDLELVTHKSPSEKTKGYCWSVSDPVSGLALARSSTKAGAVNLAHERITRAGAWQVKAKLNAENRAPSVDTLEVWTPPTAPEKPAKPDITKIVELIAERVGGLTPEEQEAVRFALNSRTGQLKAKSPSAFGDAKERLACAAWQGLQPNGFKLGLISTQAVCCVQSSKALWEKLSAVRWPAAFDKDKAALVAAGVW